MKTRKSQASSKTGQNDLHFAKFQKKILQTRLFYSSVGSRVKLIIEVLKKRFFNTNTTAWVERSEYESGFQKLEIKENYKSWETKMNTLRYTISTHSMF